MLFSENSESLITNWSVWTKQGEGPLEKYWGYGCRSYLIEKYILGKKNLYVYIQWIKYLNIKLLQL